MFTPFSPDNHGGTLAGPAQAGSSDPAKNAEVQKFLADVAVALVLRRKAILADAAAKAYAADEKAKAAQVEAFKTEIGHFRTQYLAASEAASAGLNDTAQMVLTTFQSIFQESGVVASTSNFPMYKLDNVPAVVVPWAMRQGFYGYDAIYVGVEPSLIKKLTPATVPFSNNLTYDQLAARIRAADPDYEKSLSGAKAKAYKTNSSFALGRLGLAVPYLGFTKKIGDYYKNNRPALSEIPVIATQPPSSLGMGVQGGKQDCWVQVEDGKAYVVHPKGWRFAGRSPAEKTKLYYWGKATEEQPAVGGAFAQKYWNERVVPAIKNQQAIYLKLVDAQQNLQKAEFGLRSAQQNAKAKAAEFSKFDAEFLQAMQAADALKQKMPKPLQDYSSKAATSLQAAVELDAFTEARELLLKQNASLAGQYTSLIAQAEALIAEAEAETDPLKKKRKQAEAQRRLTRAKEFADRGQALRNQSGEYGQRRTTATASARGAAKLVPTRSILPPEVANAVSNAAANAEKIVPLDQTQSQQQATGDQAQKDLTDAASKLPDEFKPSNIPPKEEKKKEGGGLGLIAAGLVAFAALRK